MKKTPRIAGLFFCIALRLRRFLRSRGRLYVRSRHELVEVLFGDAEPENFFVAKPAPWFEHLLERRVFRRRLVEDFGRGLVRRLHDLARERPQLDAASNESAQR